MSFLVGTIKQTLPCAQRPEIAKLISSTRPSSFIREAASIIPLRYITDRRSVFLPSQHWLMHLLGSLVLPWPLTPQISCQEHITRGGLFSVAVRRWHRNLCTFRYKECPRFRSVSPYIVYTHTGRGSYSVTYCGSTLSRSRYHVTDVE